jgi:hypothetical protein
MSLVSQNKALIKQQSDHADGKRKNSKKNGQSAKVLRQSDDMILFKTGEQ